MAPLPEAYTLRINDTSGILMVRILLETSAETVDHAHGHSKILDQTVPNKHISSHVETLHSTVKHQSGYRWSILSLADPAACSSK